jgi:arabinofuranosyltransferase
LSPARRDTAILLALTAGFAVWAWGDRFIQDDAFISFRYAENLAHGLGPVWNAGERVEGYTDFLWVLLLAAASRWGADLPVASQLLGVAAFAVGLLIAASIARRLDLGRGAWAVVILLGSCYSYRRYATGGLETSLQTALGLGAVALALRARSQDGYLFGAVSALLLFNRLDAAVPLAVLWLWLSHHRREMVTRAIPAAAALLLPWLVWKWSYYGGLLPNTWYAKHTTLGAALNSAGWYFLLFDLSYRWLALIPVAVVLTWREPPLRLLWAMLAAWCAYTARVGGDFMEFRFFMPLLPLLYLLFVRAVQLLSPRAVVRLALLVPCLVANLVYGPLYGEVVETGPFYVESIRGLSRTSIWHETGRRLRALFPDGKSVRIAVTPAGAIPYYSGLPAVDMLGLNDPQIARRGKGVDCTGRPGHLKRAELAYLEERAENLLIGHPQYRRHADLPRGGELAWSALSRILFCPRDSDRGRLRGKKVVAIPFRAPEDYLLAIYLTPSPEIEKRIATEHWPVFIIGS